MAGQGLNPRSLPVTGGFPAYQIFSVELGRFAQKQGEFVTLMGVAFWANLRPL